MIAAREKRPKKKRASRVVISADLRRVRMQRMLSVQRKRALPPVLGRHVVAPDHYAQFGGLVDIVTWIMVRSCSDRQDSRCAPMLDTPTRPKPAELSTKQMFMLFPTPMFTGKVPDI